MIDRDGMWDCLLYSIDMLSFFFFLLLCVFASLLLPPLYRAQAQAQAHAFSFYSTQNPYNGLMLIILSSLFLLLCCGCCD